MLPDAACLHDRRPLFACHPPRAHTLASLSVSSFNPSSLPPPHSQPSAKLVDTAPPNITFVGAELLELYDVQTAAVGNLTVAVEVVFAGNSFTDKGVLAFDYLNVTAVDGTASQQVALNLTDRVVATISAPASSAADTDAAGVSTTIFTDIPTGNSTSEGSPYSIQYDVMDDAGNK
jgi:hypothetical protein